MMADKYAESVGAEGHVATVGRGRRSPSPVVSLTEAIARLATKVDRFEAQLKRPYHGRSRFCTRASTLGPDPATGLCYIHRRYGVEACNCLKPCFWDSKN